MNDHTKELCHWGVKLGAEREGHKYLARIEGRKPGSYRYFYDLEKFNRFKEKAAAKGKQFGEDVRSGRRSIKKGLNSLVTEERRYSVAEPLSPDHPVNKFESFIDKISHDVVSVRQPKTKLSIQEGKNVAERILNKYGIKRGGALARLFTKNR